MGKEDKENFLKKGKTVTLCHVEGYDQFFFKFVSRDLWTVLVIDKNTVEVDFSKKL